MLCCYFVIYTKAFETYFVIKILLTQSCQNQLISPLKTAMRRYLTCNFYLSFIKYLRQAIPQIFRSNNITSNKGNFVRFEYLNLKLYKIEWFQYICWEMLISFRFEAYSNLVTKTNDRNNAFFRVNQWIIKMIHGYNNNNCN